MRAFSSACTSRFATTILLAISPPVAPASRPCGAARTALSIWTSGRKTNEAPSPQKGRPPSVFLCVQKGKRGRYFPAKKEGILDRTFGAVEVRGDRQHGPA